MKKKILVLALTIILGLCTTSCGANVEEIALAEESIQLKIDDSQFVSYEITPEEAADKAVSWESSDENVAIVDKNGEIKAVGKGSCTIKVTADEKSDELSVVVRAVDFNQIFEDCELDKKWATVGYDGSYLSIDTNPKDEDDYTDYTAYLSIYTINDALGLPDSLIEDMGHTSSLDGKQSETFEDVTVSWKYHPDNGLEITYKIN